MPKVVIPYEPQPRQQLYHQTICIDELLYGGAAGGGKSEATIWDALMYAMTYPESRQIIFRRTFPDLQRSIIARTLVAYPKALGKYNQSKHEWIFVNGSVVELAYFDSDSHKPNYDGAEYDVIRWEELTHFEEGWYTFMLSRLRGSKPYPRYIKSTTNPGNVGHAWVKKRFIDIGEWEKVHHVHETDETGSPLFHPDTGAPIISRRVFIPARVQDNPALLRADPNYIVRLMQLSEQERKQKLDGDWDTFAGQFFGEFSRAMHVVKPFRIPREWRRFRMMDEGYNDPFVCLWGALDRSGNLYIYREFIRSKLLSSEQAAHTKRLTGAEQIDYTVGDTSFWNKSKTSGEAPFEVFVKAGIPMIQATKERVNGWKRVREWLHPVDVVDPVTGETHKEARLRIFDTCTGLIEALPSMVTDEHNPEDVAAHPLDHAPDALRYGLMSRPAPAIVTEESKPVPFPFKTEDDDYESEGAIMTW
ncbi:terminase large subunit domain-containing protein [Gorillibacterium timonense]|uniref:terminase large subunit domain-containing protein n=1 Tax=Gorillibacterium timonense TaxID=1689269 RepID=UPI00071DAC9F|nr:terminase family protein [Gorillibacterium timonense]